MSQVPSNNPIGLPISEDRWWGVRSTLGPATLTSLAPQTPTPDDLTDRFTEVIRRIPDHLPGDLAAEFRAMITPQALAIMAGVLVVWAGSHALGVGFIVSGGLLVVGVIMLGASVVEVGKLIGQAISTTVSARSMSDLDSAAKDFSHAIAIIGVQAFLALLLKKAPGARSGKGKPTTAPEPPPVSAPSPTLPPPPVAKASKPTAAAIAASTSATIADDVVRLYTNALGRTGVQGQTFENFRTAIDYFARYYPDVAKNAKVGAVDTKVLGFLTGLDMRNPVRIVKLKPPVELVQWSGGWAGQWFTLRGGTTADVAVAGAGRTPKRFKVMQEVEVLESRASGTVDIWTPNRRYETVTPKKPQQIAQEQAAAARAQELGPDYLPGSPRPDQIPKGQWGEMVNGGGVQFFIPMQEQGKLLGWLAPAEHRAVQRAVSNQRKADR
jgi:hypothetical protein